MGMFDTIHFNCPVCKNKIEVQTKGGKCDLLTYHQKSVPADAAGYVRGDNVTCANCNNSFYIAGPEMPRVKLRLVKNIIEDHYYD